jgi:hypothetical protein
VLSVSFSLPVGATGMVPTSTNVLVRQTFQLPIRQNIAKFFSRWRLNEKRKE